MTGRYSRPAVSEAEIAAEIQRRYHGVLAWHGRQTREWWAYVPNAPAFANGATPGQLDLAIRTALGARP